MNECRIRTTTKKFNVRFLYVAIGLLLRNLWVWLHYLVLLACGGDAGDITGIVCG